MPRFLLGIGVLTLIYKWTPSSSLGFSLHLSHIPGILLYLSMCMCCTRVYYLPSSFLLVVHVSLEFLPAPEGSMIPMTP